MKNRNSLMNNSLYNVFYRLLNVLFPLITATYVAKVLLARGVGQVSYAQNIVSYFTMTAALGIPSYGTREIAKVRENKQKASELFSELFLINAISTMLCIITYYAMIICVPSFYQNMKLYLIVGLAVVFNFFNVEWFYQGVEDYEYIAKRSFLVKSISLMGIFLFVRDTSDTIAYATIYCLGIGGNNFFNLINLKQYNIKFSIKDSELSRHFKPIFILLASTVAIELYTMVDTTMLGFYCEDENVGYYTNAMKLVKILIGVITAIGGVLLPRLSYYHAHGLDDECSKAISKVFAILIYLLVPSGIGIWVIAEQVMPLLFGPSFQPGVVTLRIASLLICTLGLSNLFGTQVLLTFGDEKKLLGCTVSGAIINIILNSILIPQYAQNGAAFASVISETVVTTMTILFSLKYIKIRIDMQFIVSMFISSAGLIAATKIVQNVYHQNLKKMILSILVGGMVYVVMTIITKNQVVFELSRLIKTKTGR